MAARLESESKGVRLAALLLIAALAAGPLSTHIYWMLGGTWGLYINGVREDVASTGTRVVAAVVVVLLVAAVLVVLARVGLWKQRWAPDLVVRLFAWGLAAFFLLETLAAFTWSRDEWGWQMYGPVSLLIAVLALIVAGSDGSRPHLHRRHPVASH